jgi:HAE1 family hydrophobic/amphiphilic exporter-1
MLMGLVTKNAILLVDFTNQLRAAGQDRAHAILEAGQAADAVDPNRNAQSAD